MTDFVKAPRLSNNGTSPEVLVNGFEDAAMAMLDAIQKMRRTAPHARDYADGLDFLVAQKQHNDRMERAEKIMLEYGGITRQLLGQ